MRCLRPVKGEVYAYRPTTVVKPNVRKKTRTLNWITRTFWSLKVAASRRRVISSIRGCRHVPGVDEAEAGGGTVAVFAAGVEGALGNAIVLLLRQNVSFKADAPAGERGEVALTTGARVGLVTVI